MKDAFYFPHDSNAKDDPKMVMLIEQLGMEGYGIYWVLVETLRDQPEYCYPIMLIPALARRYNTTTEKMKAVVLKYDLFKVQNEQFFYSESEKKHVRPPPLDGAVMRTHCNRIAIAMHTQCLKE